MSYACPIYSISYANSISAIYKDKCCILYSFFVIIVYLNMFCVISLNY